MRVLALSWYSSSSAALENAFLLSISCATPLLPPRALASSLEVLWKIAWAEPN